MKINRNDKQYIDVENFVDYEFTSCIAYEMAIRNNRVIELLKNQLEHMKRNNNSGNSDIESELLEKFYINEFYLSYHFFSDIVDIEKEKSVYGWRWQTDPDIKREIEKKEEEQILSIEKKEEEQILSIEHFKGFSVFSRVADSCVPEHSVLLTNFSRPPLESFPIIKELDVRLNFSLPEKDLLEYIKHIKKEFDRNNNIIKSGFEILNDIELSNSDKINSRDILSYKDRVADMFFIYDCMKLSYKVLKIRYMLEDYYSSKGIETKSFTEKTIKKYYELARHYIDNCAYKELITGINKTELTKIESGNFRF